MSHGGGSFDGWLERVHPEDRERFSRDVEAFLSSSAREAHVEYRLRRVSGGYVPVRDRLVVERDEDGSPLRLVSMVEERASASSPVQEPRYRELFQQTRDAVFLVDARGCLLDYNRAFLDLLDLSAVDARGTPMDGYYQDPEVRRRLVEEVREEGGVSDVEIHLLASDGSPRVVLGSAVASRDAGGAYIGHQAIFHDITERSQTEEGRRRRTARLVERVGVLQALYAISERLARAEHLDRNILEEVVALIPGGLAFPDRARARVVVGSLEVSARGFDPVEAWDHQLPAAAEGAPPGSVAVSYLPSPSWEPPREITDEEVAFLAEVAARLTETARRIHAVETRRPEEAYHRMLVERSQDLLAIFDADGGIRFLSPSAERLLGFTPDSLIGESALELVHPEDREAVEAALAETAADPERALTLEHRVRHADGTWRFFESTGRSFRADSDIRGIVINSRDITDRKGLEEQLRHAQTMEAVARLAGGVAHEFNNLLTVIHVSTRLIVDGFEGDEPPEELEDIEAAAARAAVLTRRLLAFSRRDIPNPRSLDLAGVVRDLEPFLIRLAPEVIELNIVLPSTPLPIRADARQIEQVIINLFENALEAMPEGGPVVLEARIATPEELPSQVRHPDQWAVLRVVDSGPGVPEEIRDSIFEPFFTTKEGGTGLGLATARTVVSRLGGFIEVDTAPGGGATFTVCFPRTDGGSRTAVEPEAKADFPKGRTILLVEGDAAARSVAERVLSGGGYRVLEARDGVSALTLLEAYGGLVDVLVTALDMPHVSGEALAARVLATHPDVEVLYLTAPDPARPDLPTLRRDALSHDLLPAVEKLLETGDLPAAELPEQPGGSPRNG